MLPVVSANKSDKREMYFTWDETFGIANTIIDEVIDLDQDGLKLEHSNWKRGEMSTIF